MNYEDEIRKELREELLSLHANGPESDINSRLTACQNEIQMRAKAMRACDWVKENKMDWVRAVSYGFNKTLMFYVKPGSESQPRQADFEGSTIEYIPHEGFIRPEIRVK